METPKVIGPHHSCAEAGACCSNPCGTVYRPEDIMPPKEAGEAPKSNIFRAIGRKILSNLA